MTYIVVYFNNKDNKFYNSYYCGKTSKTDVIKDFYKNNDDCVIINIIAL